MTDPGASSPKDSSPGAPSAKSATRIFVAASILTLVSVGLVSPFALVSVLLDAVPAIVVLLPPVLFGAAVIPYLRLGKLPTAWRFLLGAALGLGTLSTLVFLGGLFGRLQRWVWVAIVVVEMVVGVMAIRASRPPDDDEDANDGAAGKPNARHAIESLWLIVLPFLLLGVLVTTNAPGFIWQEEGYGYDILEYHLQVPKEYYQAGRISYLPHNVYGSFPSVVEMLYLLNMVLLEDDVDTGTSANLIHFSFAVLTVFAAWVLGSLWSRRAGVVSGVTMATTGWLAYLSGLAYVENGMLFFGLAATAVLLRSSRDALDEAAPGDSLLTRRRHMALAGLFAGFACGCKYTAVPMIAGPLLVATFLLPKQTIRHKFENGLIFVLLALVSFSPWLIRNVVTTGNPVFPLANRVFDASPPGWGPEQTDRWERGHRPGESERTFVGRLQALWNHVPADKYQRFGPAVILLGLVGLLRRKRDRTDLILVVILSLQLVVWLFATHLYARLAVVFLIPLALLAGRGVMVGGRRATLLISVLCVGACWNFYFAANLVRAEEAFGASGSTFYHGDQPGYEYFKLVNDELPSDAKILLVGEARAFYFRRPVSYNVVFNRNPFAQVVRNADSDQQIVDWLVDEGFTHVLVNWLEIKRLRASYGFAPEIDEPLFERLAQTGLLALRHYNLPGSNVRQ
ncbi:MAG: hypothetical protein IH897_08760, partial [Planctomycetes bacterium]|nr:hypothetical protein [Planctomycetota bacterium]